MSTDQRTSRIGWVKTLATVGAVTATVMASCVFIGASSASTAAADTKVSGQATATASSVYLPDGSTADKAVDGVIGGYPDTPDKEWAANDTRSGWIELRWPQPVTISKVVLWDRPNTTDQVSSGRLSFSAGTAVLVG